MEHLELIKRYGLDSAVGIEVGAWIHPIPGIQPTYVDCFETFAGEKCLMDIKGDACNIPLPSDSQDYVATSHVIEHVANPFQAIWEWGRVLKDGGLIYAVIPDMRSNWDRERDVTRTNHLWADFEADVTQVDGTHIDEFIDGVVWEEFSPGSDLSAREKLRSEYQAAISRGSEINIHFHTFTPESFRAHIESINARWAADINFKFLELAPGFPEKCPNGFLAVLQVRKDTKPEL